MHVQAVPWPVQAMHAVGAQTYQRHEQALVDYSAADVHSECAPAAHAGMDQAQLLECVCEHQGGLPDVCIMCVHPEVGTGLQV